MCQKNGIYINLLILLRHYACLNHKHHLNLEFGTHIENGHDTLIHKTHKNTKLTPDIVKEIRKTKGKDGLTQILRAKKYNVSISTMSSIENNRSWKNI